MKRLSALIKEAISRELATVAFGKRMVQWRKGLHNSGAGPVANKARSLYNNKLDIRVPVFNATTNVAEKKHPLNKLYMDSMKFFNRNPDATVLDAAILPKTKTYNARRVSARPGYKNTWQDDFKDEFHRKANETDWDEVFRQSRNKYYSQQQQPRSSSKTVRDTVTSVAAGGLFMGGLVAADNYFSKRDAAKEPQEKAASVFKESFTSVIIKAASNRD